MNKYYRYPKHHQMLSMNTKNTPFARAKKRVTPTDWEDLYRSNSLTKTWKDNKKKKQWM